MTNHEPKPRLVGPWRNLHGAVWLLGLAILAWQNWWWPGILVLVALNLVLDAVLMRVAPQAFEKVQPPLSQSALTRSSVPSSSAPPASEHRFDLLPTVCPRCGGPIRGHEVKWTGFLSADCPYCGANLPMGKG
jgi:hypothetical protein